jgi:hypothetical protein
MEYKKGDRVSSDNTGFTYMPKMILGVIVTVERENLYRVQVKEGIFSKKHMEEFFLSTIVHFTADELTLIKRSVMSNYDSIKSRIEGITGSSSIKEVDDIKNEIIAHIPQMSFLQDITTNQECQIRNSAVPKNYFKVYRENRPRQKAHETPPVFEYTSQYSKLSALKQALMWLLDNSDIKKDLVGQEIKSEIDGKIYKVKVLEVL